jgi:integrase
LNAVQAEPAKMLAQHDLTIIQAILSAGLRIGELRDLTYVDVIMLPKKGKIIVRQAKREEPNAWGCSVPLF